MFAAHNQELHDEIPLRIKKYENARQFSEDCREWLQIREDYYNRLISSSELLASNSEVLKPPYWFGSVLDGGKIVGCGLYAEPDGLLLSEMPSKSLAQLFESIRSDVGCPSRIAGIPSTSQAMVNLWTNEAGVNSRLENRWVVYRADSVNSPGTNTRGKIRLGRIDELELVKEWAHDYGAEKPAPVDVGQYLVRKLREAELYIWDADGPCTLVATSGRTSNGIRISAVYTPMGYRNSGFASAAVASLTKQLLENVVSFVTLAVADGDPAETLYQRLGFYKIGIRECYVLDEKPEKN